MELVEFIVVWNLLICFVCFVIKLCFGMRESWRTLGLYCRRIEYLDWDASCMLRIYDITSLAAFRLS